MYTSVRKQKKQRNAEEFFLKTGCIKLRSNLSYNDKNINITYTIFRNVFIVIIMVLLFWLRCD